MEVTFYAAAKTFCTCPYQLLMIMVIFDDWKNNDRFEALFDASANVYSWWLPGALRSKQANLVIYATLMSRTRTRRSSLQDPNLRKDSPDVERGAKATLVTCLLCARLQGRGNCHKVSSSRQPQLQTQLTFAQ